MAPSAIVEQAPGIAHTDQKQQPGTATATKVQNAEMGFDMGGGDLMALTQAPAHASIEAEREYLKERLAAAIRIFAHYDFDHGVAGHLTVRDPGDPHTFWVMTVSDLILVNQDGKVIGGGKPGRRIVNLAGFQIHSAIHRARPEINAICHSHSVYGKAFSALGKNIDITTQDSCAFHNDCAILTEFGGVVITAGESNAIADALEKKKAIILQNHGILTVGTTIDSAVGWFIMLEKQCQVQLLSDAAGTTVPIDEPQAIFTAKEIATERAGYFTASPYFQTIDFLQGEEYRK
ncbi:hypothetical protein RQP46_009119 [Phenoliferia psychrophenolica]